MHRTKALELTIPRRPSLIERIIVECVSQRRRQTVVHDIASPFRGNQNRYEDAGARKRKDYVGKTYALRDAHVSLQLLDEAEGVPG